MEQILDYSTYNQPNYLLQKLRESEVAEALAAGDRQFNEFETACWGVMAGIWLDTAEGVQLDILGQHLNFPREGRSDADYRTALILRTVILTSGGTIEGILSMIRLIFKTEIAEYTPLYQYFPANFSVYPGGTEDVPPAVVLPIVPAGVGFHIEYDLILDNGDDLAIGDEDTMSVLS